jgi:branched-chain amino acid transport system ATP-binding protein
VAVIVGPNGAGKSTAMKAVLGMLRLTSGRVTLDGRDTRRSFLGARA